MKTVKMDAFYARIQHYQHLINIEEAKLNTANASEAVCINDNIFNLKKERQALIDYRNFQMDG